MASRQDLIDSIDPSKNYLGTFVISRLKEVEPDGHRPSTLRKGDVLSIFTSSKPRPVVIIKVLKDSVICIPLTSEDGQHSLLKFNNNRFFNEGFFCNSYVIVKKEIAMTRYIGIFEDSKTLNIAISELRKFINKNI